VTFRLRPPAARLHPHCSRRGSRRSLSVPGAAAEMRRASNRHRPVSSCRVQAKRVDQGGPTGLLEAGTALSRASVQAHQETSRRRAGSSRRGRHDVAYFLQVPVLEDIKDQAPQSPARWSRERARNVISIARRRLQQSDLRRAVALTSIARLIDTLDAGQGRYRRRDARPRPRGSGAAGGPRQQLTGLPTPTWQERDGGAQDHGEFGLRRGTRLKRKVSTRNLPPLPRPAVILIPSSRRFYIGRRNSTSTPTRGLRGSGGKGLPRGPTSPATASTIPTRPF